MRDARGVGSPATLAGGGGALPCRSVGVSASMRLPPRTRSGQGWPRRAGIRQPTRWQNPAVSCTRGPPALLPPLPPPPPLLLGQRHGAGPRPTMRLRVSITAGKPVMTGRKRSCTSHTSSAVSSGASLPRTPLLPAAVVAMARTAAAGVSNTGCACVWRRNSLRALCVLHKAGRPQSELSRKSSEAIAATPTLGPDLLLAWFVGRRRPQTAQSA